MSRPLAIEDPGGVAGLSAYGLAGSRATAADRRPPASQAPSAAETRLALNALSGVLGAVYVTSGLTLLGALEPLAEILVALGMLQAAWVALARRGSRPALACGVLLNGGLAGAWLLSRTVGLGNVQPVGVLDGLCAADSALVALLAASSLTCRAPRRLRRGLTQPAILLAVLTVSALLGGHTHTARAAGQGVRGGGASGPVHLYCRLL